MSTPGAWIILCFGVIVLPGAAWLGGSFDWLRSRGRDRDRDP